MSANISNIHMWAPEANIAMSIPEAYIRLFYWNRDGFGMEIDSLWCVTRSCYQISIL